MQLAVDGESLDDLERKRERDDDNIEELKGGGVDCTHMRHSGIQQTWGELQKESQKKKRELHRRHEEGDACPVH